MIFNLYTEIDFHNKSNDFQYCKQSNMLIKILCNMCFEFVSMFSTIRQKKIMCSYLFNPKSCRTLLLSLSIASICVSKLVRSLSNDTRQRKQQCATRTLFDLLKKNSTFYTRFSRTKHTQKESGEPNFNEAYKKVRKLFLLIRFFS